MRIRAIVNLAKRWVMRSYRYCLSGVWQDTRSTWWINLIKIINLSATSFLDKNLQQKASALTYSSILALVPVLAMIFAIGRGFGFQNMVESGLLKFIPLQGDALSSVMSFVDSYLEQSSEGVFVGIGIIFLLWSLVSLLGNVEDTFNHIWGEKTGRSFYRKVTDYTAIFMILPVLMICSNGIAIYMSVATSGTLLSPVVGFVLDAAPTVLIWLFFTLAYMLIPNTRVKVLSALIPGILCGTTFQVVQWLMLSGQIYVSKYNAIYGSFAVLPLLLMWLQLSWVICLFGAELSYASQNVKKFSFEQDSQHISRRYKDFLTLLIASLIVKRFAQGDEPPYTANELSETYRIPIRLTNQILHLLKEVKIITEVNYGNDDRVAYFQPAMDINRISVSFLFQQIDQYGSENFKIDTDKLFCKEWQLLLNLRQEAEIAGNSLLLKDL